MKFKIIPGNFSSYNYNSCDIGWQGLLASGNNNFVQITDPKTGQLIQTLERHSQYVHLVRWAPCCFHHDLKKPYSLKLASADIGGTIVIWDATFSTILSDFSRNSKKVLEMRWLRNQEVAIDFLLVLHSGNELVLWNSDSGNKVWDKSFSVADIGVLLDFCVDPHDQINIAFRGDNFLLLLSGISLNKPPDGNGRKFYICNQSDDSPPETRDVTLGRAVLTKSSQLIKATTKLVKDLGGNEIFKVVPPLASQTASTSNSQCIQVLYHSYCQNHIILVYPREILVMDLMIFQAVACITLDKNVSSFIQVYSCWQNDIIFCLHESGIVTIRGRRPIVMIDDDESANDSGSNEILCSNPFVNDFGDDNEEKVGEGGEGLDLEGMKLTTESWIEAGPYQLLCQTESPRLMRNVRVVGMTAVPICETMVTLLCSDGKIQIWQMRSTPIEIEVVPKQYSYLLSPQNFVRVPEKLCGLQHPFSPMLYELMCPMVDMDHYLGHLSVSTNSSNSNEQSNDALNSISPSWVVGSYRIINGDKSVIGRTEKWAKLSLNMVALYQGLTCDATVIKANPIDFNEDLYNSGCPFVAVGNSKGVVQIWNIETSQLEREIQAMHSSIRGLDWLQVAESDSSNYTHITGELIVYGYNIAGSSSIKAKNSISIVRLESGKVIDLRPESNFEATIECVRVSYLRQYFAVLLKDGLIEVWDSKNLTKLRDVPINAPNRHVTILEWSNYRSGSNVSNNKSDFNSFVKEKFLTIDSTAMMQHVVIEGGAIIKGKQVPVETSLNKISAMAYRNSIVVLGDIDGNLLFWNFKASRTMPGLVNQGRINRISFDNLPLVHSSPHHNKFIVVLSADGFSVWNWNEAILIKMIKWTKDTMNRIVSYDWLDQGHSLVLLSCNGVSSSNAVELAIVRATSLEHTSSVVGVGDFAEPIACPAMLPPKLSLILKYHLQHQPWETSNSLLPTDWCNQTSQSGLRDHKIDVLLNRLNQEGQLDCFKSTDNAAYDLARRCYATALLFGDEYEFKVWSLILTTYFGQEIGENYIIDIQLPWEQTWPYRVYRAYQRSRLWSLERKRSTPRQTQKCAEAFIMLGELDRAVRLLLETSPGHPSYVADLQMACLLSSSTTTKDSIPTNQQHHSTVKLAATQLVANNCLKEGVQLLCSIRNYADACRYLQTYGEWRTALWLAKCTLSDNEIRDLEKLYAQHQSLSTTKSSSVLQYILLGDITKAAELAAAMHQCQLTVRLVEFSSLIGCPIIDESLVRTSIIEFAQHLDTLGCHDAAKYYIENTTVTAVTQPEESKAILSE